MPHFVIEYSREITKAVDIHQLMDIVFSAASESGVMQADDIKVRAMPYDYYRLQKQGDTFVHITVSLLDGRSDQQKERVSLLVREALSQFMPEVTSISIDVRDMNAIAYKKRLL